MTRGKNLVANLLVIYLFVGSSIAFITRLTEGNGVNFCGAVVTQCMNQCDERSKAGKGGTEYVQWTITYETSETKCTTKETAEDGMVSANPPNDNKKAVVFNVPCCQQRPVCPPVVPGGRNENTAQPITTKTSTTTTITRTSQIIDILGIIGTRTPTTTTTEEPGFMVVKETLILVFVILCFVLILIVLMILLWKMAKKRRKKTLKPSSGICPSAGGSVNGAVLVAVTNEKPNPRNKNKFDEKASEDIKLGLKTGGVANGTVLFDHTNEKTDPEVENESGKSAADDEKSPAVNYQNDQQSSVQSSTQDPRENGIPSPDYILLETLAPESAPKSSRTRGMQDKSDEVIIVGTGRRGAQGNGHNGNVPNGYIPNQIQEPSSIVAIDAGQPLEGVMYPGDTMHTEAPERHSDEEKDFNKNRSDSLAETFEIAHESEYDTLLRNKKNNSDYNTTSGRSRTESELNHSTDKTLPDPNGIYNVLRGNGKSQTFSDYQRLQRTQPNQNSKDHETSISTQEENMQSPPSRRAFDGYVEDFQFLNPPNLQVGGKSDSEITILVGDYIECPLPLSGDIDDSKNTIENSDLEEVS